MLANRMYFSLYYRCTIFPFFYVILILCNSKNVVEQKIRCSFAATLEDMKVVDRVSDDTIIIHQMHKRVWPANQRESLFWTHIRRVDSMKDPEANDLYIVCNHHIEREDIPVSSNCIRIGVTIAMVCQTVINKRGNEEMDLSNIRRDDLTCKILYVAQVNPGGWAPASALRIVYKREYPKFLKLFTQYVIQKTKEQRTIKF